MPEANILGRIETRIEVVVRPAVEEDLPALGWMGLFSADRGTINEAFAAQQRGDGLMLLAVTGEFPVAQVWIDFARNRATDVAVLWAIRTFHPLQRAGIGGTLLQICEAVLRQHGFTWAELEVDRDNQDAVRFYRRHGWRAPSTTPQMQAVQKDTSADSAQDLLVLCKQIA